MSLIDELLKADFKQIDDKAKVKVSKLSKLLGHDVEVTVQAIDGKRYRDIRNMATKTVKNKTKFDVGQFQDNVVLNGVVEPSLKDKDLLDRFKVATPLELMDKLFYPGDINKLSDKISELSGFDEEENEEIKN